MNILVVDDERPALFTLEETIKQAVPDCSPACFLKADKALAYAKETRVDVAFLDINMAEMNGLELAKQLKDIYGKTNILFVTGYQEYALDALAMAASGYIMKPATPDAVILEMNRLRNPVEPQHSGRVRIQCFGDFTVFVDGEPLTFTRSKAKELLALLVHKNGADVSNAEIATVLWEDKSYSDSLQSYTRSVRAQLIKILKNAGVEYIVRKSWNSIAIDVNKITCDYLEVLNGNVPALNTYTGKYMSEYSWAEFAIANIAKRAKKIK